MPAHVIAAARSSGGAGRSASRVIAHACFTQGLPTLLLETPPVEGGTTRLALVPPLMFDPEEMSTVIAQRDRSETLIAYIEEPSEGTLRRLLPLADTITVTGDRTGNFDHAAELYGVGARLEITGAAGRVLRPWLLPSGWPCRRNPGVRLQGWQLQLERRAFPGRLRCIPLVFPWSDPGSVLRASKERVDTIGMSLLEHLTTIASGRAPDRPSSGMAGGDPWPDLPPPAPVVQLFKNRPRLTVPQGA